MTSKGSGREPSMDEIMSQIRSIIAADESKGRPAVVRGVEKGGDADVLDLTEMVNDDGSVSKVAAGNPVDKPVVADFAKPATITDADDGFASTPAPPADLAPIFAGGAANERPVAPQAQPPRPAPPPAPQPPMARPVPMPAAMPQPVIVQTVAPQPAPPPLMVQQPLAPQPAMAPPRPQPSTTAAPMSDLLSNAAAGAAASALERLAAVSQQQAKAAAPQPAMPLSTIGGRSLEDLVQDLLRPMLKQWLDTNLPSIVERMVAQEIIKISKR